MPRKPKNPPHVFGKLRIPPRTRIVAGGLVKAGKGKEYEGAWPTDDDDAPDVEPEYKVKK